MTERRSAVRIARGERGIWQRRFWEHRLVDDVDFAAHIDYCHINPLKHGLVKQVADWPYSLFIIMLYEKFTIHPKNRSWGEWEPFVLSPVEA